MRWKFSKKIQTNTGFSPPKRISVQTSLCFLHQRESKAGFLHQVQQGGYFGELALVNHDKRAATVAAKDDVKVACEFLITMIMMLNLGDLSS